MRFFEYLEGFFNLVQFAPLAVSLASGLVAMFAAFAGMHDLMATAGSVAGAGAMLFLVLMAM
jgi:hypothetical protein